MSPLASLLGPEDLRRMEPAELPPLADEIRQFLVSAVAGTGGHLGPNLGIVEVTLALHRVFDSPREPILWDTGHQAYTHKIITGRAAGFAVLRQRDGLSGYPCRSESEHDWVENSHASTSLSYAIGLARAAALTGDRRHVVAVIGDGALTGGMAWEALNDLASTSLPVVVVLNDNGRSYSPTVGGLAALTARPASDGQDRPVAVFFRELGVTYVGPVDGHDVTAVEQALRDARACDGPVVVHCLTRKGCGYAPAEQDDADRFHSVPRIDPATGCPRRADGRTWTEVFGESATALATADPTVVAVTAAMLRPVGLSSFARAHPSRVFDVGIAEQHAVTLAAGLALGGLRPLVCLYATFLNRAFDQVLLDVALHRLPVVLVLDRAGVTGEDGASHHGMWDLGLLSAVPGLAVAAPRDEPSLRELLSEAVVAPGPVALRYPKGCVPPDVPAQERRGSVDVLGCTGSDVLLVSFGAMAATTLEVASRIRQHGIGSTVVDPRYVAPVDPALVELAARHRLVVTVEDAGRANGGGAVLAAALRDRGVDTPVRVHGIAQEFLHQGSREQLLDELGLGPQALALAVTGMLAALPSSRSASPVDVDVVAPRAPSSPMLGQVRQRHEVLSPNADLPGSSSARGRG